jgi:hypothetical protein
MSLGGLPVTDHPIICLICEHIKDHRCNVIPRKVVKTLPIFWDFCEKFFHFLFFKKVGF